MSIEIPYVWLFIGWLKHTQLLKSDTKEKFDDLMDDSFIKINRFKKIKTLLKNYTGLAKHLSISNC